jgi:hypothetical protein
LDESLRHRQIDHNKVQSTLRSIGGGDKRLSPESPERTRKRGLLRVIGATVVGAVAFTWGTNTLKDIADGVECYGEKTVTVEPNDTLFGIAEIEVEGGEAIQGSVANYIANMNDIDNPLLIQPATEIVVPEFCEKY